MKVLQRGLRKEDIALSKGYMRWYREVDGELRLFVNESKRADNGELENVIDWKNSVAYLCTHSLDYCKTFYNKYKDLDVRLFVKADTNTTYLELKVSAWRLSDKGLELDL